jgi:enolase-phosphatase E1
MDAALHPERRRSRISTGLLRRGVLSARVTVRLAERGIDLVLLDIEGTTTPMAFVYDVLFPFARLKTESYLREHSRDPRLHEPLAALREEWQEEAANGEAPPQWNVSVPESAAQYLFWLMDRDRKSPMLKRIQGEIWEAGFHAGELRGEVFQDVAPAFERWQRSKIDIAIYSSGSIVAQRLIFGASNAGDLTHFISSFFDTAVGPKRSADSYRRIAGEMRRAPSTILFVSDVPEELDAAFSAGCQILLAVRPGNREIEGPVTMDTIASFDEII